MSNNIKNAENPTSIVPTNYGALGTLVTVFFFGDS
jgi:hypothetical protein